MSSLVTSAQCLCPCPTSLGPWAEGTRCRPFIGKGQWGRSSLEGTRRNTTIQKTRQIQTWSSVLFRQKSLKHKNQKFVVTPNVTVVNTLQLKRTKITSNNTNNLLLILNNWHDFQNLIQVVCGTRITSSDELHNVHKLNHKKIDLEDDSCFIQAPDPESSWDCEDTFSLIW